MESEKIGAKLIHHKVLQEAIMQPQIELISCTYSMFVGFFFSKNWSSYSAIFKLVWYMKTTLKKLDKNMW